MKRLWLSLRCWLEGHDWSTVYRGFSGQAQGGPIANVCTRCGKWLYP